MAPTIHLVRHAHGFHNISREHENIKDPGLTELGEQQCKSLREIFPYHSQLACFVSSPLRRALSTCLLAFAPAPGAPIVALPELKEVGDSPCDTGSSPEILRKEINHLLDLSRVPVGWDTIPDWISWQDKLGQLKERAARARVALQQLVQCFGEDEHIVVVTHGAFLHFLADDYHGIKPNNGIHKPHPSQCKHVNILKPRAG